MLLVYHLTCLKFAMPFLALLFFITFAHAADAPVDVKLLPSFELACGRIHSVCAANGGASSQQPLNYIEALRAALLLGTAAQTEGLNQVLQQAQWGAAKAVYEPKYSLSGGAQQVKPSSDAASSNQNKVSAGVTWSVPSDTGMRLRAQLDRNLSDSRQSNWVFELVQPLLRGAGAVARYPYKLAQITARMGELNRNQQLDSVYAAVSFAYIQAVAGQQQVRLSQAALDRVLHSKEVNLALFQAGRIAKLELLQSDADVAQAVLGLARARNEALSSTSALLQLMGPEWADRQAKDVLLVESLPMMEVIVVPQSYEQAVIQAQASRADLQLAKDALEIERIGVAQVVDDALPKVDLSVSHSIQSHAFIGSGTNSSTISLNWEIPLDASQLRLQQVRAQVSLQRAELAYADALRQVRSDVVSSLRALEFSKAQLALAAETVEIIRRKLDAENERFRVGKSSSFQLSSAQNELSNAENNHAQAVQTMLRSVIDYDRATGGVTARREAVLQKL